MKDPLKGVVDAVVVLDYGLKFSNNFLVSDHPALKKLIARKKLLLSNN
jgi:hypothetical protein